MNTGTHTYTHTHTHTEHRPPYPIHTHTHTHTHTLSHWRGREMNTGPQRDSLLSPPRTMSQIPQSLVPPPKVDPTWSCVLTPALETTCPCCLLLPCPLGPSLCLWGGSYPGKVGCFLKATLLAGLGLWFSSLSCLHFLRTNYAPGHVLGML